MRIQCNHFDTEPASCRFYAFPEGSTDRFKIHVDGEVNFGAVVAQFVQMGVHATVEECIRAHGGLPEPEALPVKKDSKSKSKISGGLK